MQRLVNLLEKLDDAGHKDRIIKKEGEELINVNVMTSAIAFMYEKVRTIVDYNEEHLLRKNAIFRILKRRFLTGGDYYDMAENLIKELISARYIANNFLPESKIHEAALIIEKYAAVYDGIEQAHGLSAAMSLYDWIFSLASVEIEECLAPSNKEKVFMRFMYDIVKEKIEIVSDFSNEDEKNLQIFIAVNRSLIKSDKPMLEYLIFKLWFPEWKNNYYEVFPRLIDEIFVIKEEINKRINHKLANRLLQVCRRYATMVKILRDVIYQNQGNAPELAEDFAVLEGKIREVCQARYKETKRRLKTQIFRAIIYVFLTKMLLALVLEVPFDYYIVKSFNWLALGINIAFPPLLMILIATTIRTPSEKNTVAMINGIKEILSGADGEVKYIKETKKRNWFVWLLFNSIYIITFLVPFILIVYGLYRINFSIMSIVLFLIFLSIVSFFGVRIRNSARELIVLKRKENIIGEIFDFMTLPFIRMGRFLSMNFSKINIFVFFLDFIIEAPLKIVLQAIEEWLAFFKEKKEDLE